MPVKPKQQPQKLTKANANAITKLVNKHLKDNNLSGYKLDSFSLKVVNEKVTSNSEKPNCSNGQVAVKVHKNGTWYWDCQ